MDQREFKRELFACLKTDVEGLDFSERMELAEKYLFDFQKENDKKREKKNRGKPWSDHELRIILQDAPTAENCLKYAKLFGRGYGSLEQIYRWAGTDIEVIKKKRPNDSFVLQVKRIATELGWRF